MNKSNTIEKNGRFYKKENGEIQMAASARGNLRSDHAWGGFFLRERRAGVLGMADSGLLPFYHRLPTGLCCGKEMEEADGSFEHLLHGPAPARCRHCRRLVFSAAEKRDGAADKS